MKKVGIISLYEGQNFGNKLQNYAVEQIVKEYGFDPVTFKYELVRKKRIDNPSLIQKLSPQYISAYIKNQLSNEFGIKNTAVSITKQVAYVKKNAKLIDNSKKLRVEKYQNFDDDFLNFSSYIIPYDEKNTSWTNDFYMFLAGSDQVWNPYYSFVGPNNFLCFVGKEKRAAIAPSFGVSEIPDQRKSDYKKWLSDFKYLSVREQKGASIIQELTGKDPVVIADPTLLIDNALWNEMSIKPSFQLPQKYLLTYFLGDKTKKYYHFIRKYAKRNDLEIVDLVDVTKPEYFSCDPAEFIYCIKNANFICTDSFHATVFSILNKREFVVFDRIEGKRSMSSRIVTLLDSFGLENRRFNYIKSVENVDKTNYQHLEDNLNLLRRAAKDYLDNVLVNNQ